MYTYKKRYINFSSAVTGDKFRDRVTANCKTSNIVYLIGCQKSTKEYVGETENPLHLRINGHRSDYYPQLSDKSVVEHFNTIGHSFDDMTLGSLNNYMWPTQFDNNNERVVGFTLFGRWPQTASTWTHREMVHQPWLRLSRRDLNE